MVYTLSLAQTCTGAGKSAGTCRWSTTNSCYVPGGRCYCDRMCTTFNDCCADVTVSILSHGKVFAVTKCAPFLSNSIATESQLSRNRADLKQRLRVRTCLKSAHLSFLLDVWLFEGINVLFYHYTMYSFRTCAYSNSRKVTQQ